MNEVAVQIETRATVHGIVAGGAGERAMQVGRLISHAALADYAKVRLGSHTRIKYDVVGHAVNLASRLESFTVGGQVFISESTHQAIADQFIVAGPLEALVKGVESAIRLWEVRGEANKVDKTLPPTVPGLTRLAQPIPVRFRLITGKQISPESYKARLLQLSPAGAELETKLELEAFSSLQVELVGLSGESFLIDCKVVGVGEPESSFIIKCSRTDDAAAAALKCWLELD